VRKRKPLSRKATPLYKGDIDMLLTIALILFVLWALGLFAFHVTTGLIHLLLIIAVIVIVLHFIRGRRAV
jgi:hypothetical protein